MCCYIGIRISTGAKTSKHNFNSGVPVESSTDKVDNGCVVIFRQYYIYHKYLAFDLQ